MRSLSSSFDETRMPLRKLLAILLKKHSIILSQDACFGVNTKEKRFGTVNRNSLVSLDVCAEWLSSVITSFISGGKALSKCLILNSGSRRSIYPEILWGLILLLLNIFETVPPESRDNSGKPCSRQFSRICLVKARFVQSSEA